MDAETKLQNIVKWRTQKGCGRNISKLGDVVDWWMKRVVVPKAEKFSPLSEVWSQLLPPTLAEHCRIDSFSGGVLKIAVDSSAYMYELRLCSHMLLEQLQKTCPKARIRQIKPVLKRSSVRDNSFK